jgi:hypothetical protein
VVAPDSVHCTTEPLTKLVPFTVSRNCVPPAVTVAGVMDVVVGALTVKLTAFDVTLLEVTVTRNVPALATRPGGTVAVT